MSQEPEHIADDFHSLVSAGQANEIREFDLRLRAEQERARELRAQSGAGMNASELLAKLCEDPGEEEQKVIETERSRLQAERAEQAKPVGPDARFPPPVITPHRK